MSDFSKESMRHKKYTALHAELEYLEKLKGLSPDNDEAINRKIELLVKAELPSEPTELSAPGPDENFSRYKFILTAEDLATPALEKLSVTLGNLDLQISSLLPRIAELKTCLAEIGTIFRT